MTEQDRAAPRRAPRLRPDERIAPYIPRRGRFRRFDPSKGRKLPSRWAWLGTGLWAAWMGYAGVRAWRASQEDGPGG